MILIIYIVISLTEQLVRIATFNVNGVNGLLPVLLRWLEATKPDIECLQELKTPQGNFPEAGCVARPKELERCCHTRTRDHAHRDKTWSTRRC
jgi:exonuclease III